MNAFRGSLAKVLAFAVVTIVVTTVLGMTIASSNVAPTQEYSARFTDASGLQVGDDVRILGVKVGQVTALSSRDGRSARVDFEIEASRRLAANTSASIKYRNLAGQRYVALDAGVSDPNRLLPAGAEIPLDRTKPALNLTQLFNGFQPLFQALSPRDVNKLSFEIIQVLQGEGGTVDSILSHTASLTQAIAKKDQVIGQVIDNLNTVLATVNQNGQQLGELTGQLQQLVTGFSQQREPIGNAVDALGGLTNTTSDLLRDTRPHVRSDIEALGGLATNLNRNSPDVDRALKILPGKLQSLTRTVSYGSWFNFYLCRMSGTISIDKLGVEVPINPLPETEMAPRCKP